MPNCIPRAERMLVALDLDGTLLNYDSTLSAAHERAVRELQRRGVLVTIATGRMVLTSRWIYERLRLTVPMVGFNGGWIGIPGHQPLVSAMLSGAEMREILAELARPDYHDIARCGYPDATTWIMDRDLPMTLRWRTVYGVDIRIDPAPFVDWQGPSYKVMVVAEPQRMQAIISSLRRAFAGRYQVVLSQEDRLEILPRSVTKGWGLEHLAAHLGIRRENVWAVGDADNDREMLEWAGHPCVMGQAAHGLRALGRHILPGVQARGLCALPDLVESYRR